MAWEDLNPRQQRFVLEYVADGNATQAAIRSGYSLKTAESQASRLLRNVGIAEEIERRSNKIAERATRKLELSKEWVLDRLMKAAERGAELDELSALNRSLELLGKEVGMFKEGPLVNLDLREIRQVTRVIRDGSDEIIDAD